MRILAILLIALCFVLFIVLFVRMKPGNGYLRLDESGHAVEVFEQYWYAAAMGDYTTRTGAEAAGRVVRERGGAGYVVERNGVFTVTAASYRMRADAESVVKALTSEGENCGLLEFKIAAGRLKLNAGGKPLAAVYAALEFFYDAAERLEKTGFALDKGEKDAAAALGEVKKLSAALDSALAAVAAEGKDISFEAKLTARMQAVKLAIGQAADTSLTAGQLSAAVKYAALACVDNFVLLLTEIY